MTEPAATSPREFADIDDVFSLLRAEGHRVTPAARFVLEVFTHRRGPLFATHQGTRSGG